MHGSEGRNYFSGIHVYEQVKTEWASCLVVMCLPHIAVPVLYPQLYILTPSSAGAVFTDGVSLPHVGVPD